MKEHKKEEKKDFDLDFSVCVLEGDPLSYDEAMRSHDSIFWKEAADDEMYSIISNNT